jgi:hypothetical protein
VCLVGRACTDVPFLHLLVTTDGVVRAVRSGTVAVDPAVAVEEDVVGVMKPVGQVDNLRPVALVIELLTRMPEVVLCPSVDVALSAQLHHPPIGLRYCRYYKLLGSVFVNALSTFLAELYRSPYVGFELNPLVFPLGFTGYRLFFLVAHTSIPRRLIRMYRATKASTPPKIVVITSIAIMVISDFTVFIMPP